MQQVYRTYDVHSKNGSNQGINVKGS